MTDQELTPIMNKKWILLHKNIIKMPTNKGNEQSAKYKRKNRDGA